MTHCVLATNSPSPSLLGFLLAAQLANDRQLSHLGDKLCDKLEVFFEGVEVRELAGMGGGGAAAMVLGPFKDVGNCMYGMQLMSACLALAGAWRRACCACCGCLLQVKPSVLHGDLW